MSDIINEHWLGQRAHYRQLLDEAECAFAEQLVVVKDQAAVIRDMQITQTALREQQASVSKREQALRVAQDVCAAMDTRIRYQQSALTERASELEAAEQERETRLRSALGSADQRLSDAYFGVRLWFLLFIIAAAYAAHQYFKLMECLQ